MECRVCSAAMHRTHKWLCMPLYKCTLYKYYNEAVSLDFQIDVINAHIRVQKHKKTTKKGNGSRNHFDAETTELAQIQSHAINAIRMMKRFNFKLDTETKSALNAKTPFKWASTMQIMVHDDGKKMHFNSTLTNFAHSEFLMQMHSHGMLRDKSSYSSNFLRSLSVSLLAH